MGMLVGEKKKKVPNSKKKKGGLGRPTIQEQAVRPETKSGSSTKSPTTSVSDRAKAFQTTNAKPAVSERFKRINIRERAKTFTSTSNDNKPKGPAIDNNEGGKKKTTQKVGKWPPITSTEEPKKAAPKFRRFSKGKNDKLTESPVTSTKEPKKAAPKIRRFSKKKNKEAENEGVKEIATTNEANDVVTAPGKPGKLSMKALSLNIPGLGGQQRGTNQSKRAPGKPPPQIDIFAEPEVQPDSQGHAKMSDRAKQTVVSPKESGKEDWNFLYELATQYDAYKAEEVEAAKKSKKLAATKQKTSPSSEIEPGDTNAIKKNLNSLFGGRSGGGGTSYTANGKFLNNKYFDQYLVDHSSGVALEFSKETSLYKRFCRKDQEQRTISEKFVAALLKHPKSKIITQLNMSSALIPDAFLVALSNQCASEEGLPLLQVLNLESNELGREGIEALSEAIASQKAFRRLQILKLENQKKEITAGAEEVLGDAIVQSSSLVQVGLRMKGGVAKQQVVNTVQANLDKLRQARREHASKKGTLKARKRNEMETLFDDIAANKDKNITEVDLTENLRFLGLNGTETTKTGAAFSTNKYVTKITMTKLKLDDDFAEAFGKALVKNSTLETVVLDSNSFSGKGVKALLTGLGKNKSVTNFQIRHQSKTMASSDEESLPELLKDNTTLINLGTDVRNPLIKSQLERKVDGNRELQRKQRNAQKKK